MLDEFQLPQSGQPLTTLAPLVDAQGRGMNGLRSLRFETADEYGFEWEEGGAVIKGPAFNLTLVPVTFCEDGVEGTRFVLASDFVPNS